MEATLQIGALVTVIVGLCEALKVAGVASRWIPLISVILGLIGAYLLGGISFLSTASGVVLGLTTTGGYRLVKTSFLNR